MRPVFRRTAVVTLMVAAVVGGAGTLHQGRAAAAARERVVCESLHRLAEAARQRESSAGWDFEAAEVHLNGLLSLCESVDTAREEGAGGALPEIAPERLLSAYDRALSLADGDPVARQRLRNLEERFDDRLRQLLFARSSAR